MIARAEKRVLNKRLHKIAKKMATMDAPEIEKVMMALIEGTHNADIDHFITTVATIDGIRPKTMEKIEDAIKGGNVNG